MDLQAGDGGLFIKKRLGLNQNAKIKSSGKMQVSSIYARMFDLPDPEQLLLKSELNSFTEEFC